MDNNAFKGEAIYTAYGKAREYSRWICDFYNGCSSKCKYCYNSDSEYKDTLGKDIPTLKKSLHDENKALEIFQVELLQNLSELQKHGLFFCFMSDPFLPETKWLTQQAVYICQKNNVPVKVLTKQVNWVNNFLNDEKVNKDLIACGFTLTGYDELEVGASPNQERIESIKKLHNAGFKIFVSIEPVINFHMSFYMIEQTLGFCDLYFIGLKDIILHNGGYRMSDLSEFVYDTMLTFAHYPNVKVYWGNNVTDYYTIIDPQSVSCDYNMFKSE